MSAGVVAAVLLAALMHAAWNALLKAKGPDPSLEPLPVDPGAVGLSLCWALLGWPLALCAGPLEPRAWPALLGSVAIHVVYFSLLSAAYRRGALSLVYPVARGLPPMVIALGSALMGETLSPLGSAGVLAIGLGVLALQRPGASWAALALASATALCTAAYTLLDAWGVRVSGEPWRYTLHLVALQGSVFSMGALGLGGRPLLRAVWRRRRTALSSGLLSGGGYAVALWAMGQAKVAAVAALRETSVAFAALIALLFLGEPFDRRSALATALIVGGAVAIRAGG